MKTVLFLFFVFAVHITNYCQQEVLSIGYLRQMPLRQATFKRWYSIKMKHHNEQIISVTEENGII